MRRLYALVLVLVLVFALSLPVFAAGTEGFTDIQSHWALSEITEVVELSLMNGTSDTTFEPDAGLTRGMFVTILGRFSGIDPDAWKPSYDGALFQDVNPESYYMPYINWAARTGIALGSGHGSFQPDASITREQMLTMLQRFAGLTGKSFSAVGVLGIDLPDFSDADEISSWARSAVTQLRDCGLIQGMANADGSLRFEPKHTATRAQAAAIFCRMRGLIADKPSWSETFPTLLVLNERAATLQPGETLTLSAQFVPLNSTNQTVTWISSNPRVASVENGVVSWGAIGSCTVYAYSANGCKASCDFVCEKAPVVETTSTDLMPISQDLTLAYGGEPYAQKCERIFGGTVSDPRSFYTTQSAAEADMVTVTVPVWDIGSDGQKYTRRMSLVVHKNIAATVDQIFREIYDCPARYPIHSVGGFRYVARSEHNCGLAIDINPEENYYCSPAGAALVGSHFSPETDAYSIPVGGDIDQIFNKYGFTRGIYWRSGYRDYMHYSFFGT